MLKLKLIVKFVNYLLSYKTHHEMDTNISVERRDCYDKPVSFLLMFSDFVKWFLHYFTLLSNVFWNLADCFKQEA